jgi:hypothetical protein
MGGDVAGVMSSDAQIGDHSPSGGRSARRSVNATASGRIHPAVHSKSQQRAFPDKLTRSVNFGVARYPGAIRRENMCDLTMRHLGTNNSIRGRV